MTFELVFESACILMFILVTGLAGWTFLSDYPLLGIPCLFLALLGIFTLLGIWF